MLVTAHLMVSWCDMTEQIFQLFSLHPSSAFTVTVIPHYHPAVDKSIKNKKTPSTNFVAVLYMDHSISCAKFFSQKYGNAGNGVYVFENT